MAVNIRIVNTIGDKNTKEEEALKKFMLPNLKKYFTQHDEASGEIVFYVNNLLIAGQTKDVDILMVAELDNYVIDIPDKEGLKVERLCTILEAKSHDANSAFAEGQNIYTPYSDDPRHNATNQCKKELDALSSAFRRSGISAWITALIWLYGMNEKELEGIAPDTHNAIAIDSDFDRIVELACAQSNYSSGYLNCAKNNPFFLSDIDRFFTGLKQGKSLNTIKTLNLFSKEKGESLFKDLSTDGESTIIAGRAGTGKTISLLQLATYISGERNERCLFITYNTALVSDIKRMLNFAPYVALGNIDIYSAEKFFGDILKNNGVWEKDQDYEKAYISSIRSCLASYCSIEYDNSYDYIFVDEAQDWAEEEKNMLLRLYPANKIIVADGLDQFVRSTNKIKWGAYKEVRNISLRQKSNIVSFVNAYAASLNLGWKVEPNMMFQGGRVNIYHNYSSNIHDSFLSEAKDQFCDEYDFLFLVPPSLYDPNQGFTLKQKYEERGIRFFDGTLKTNRDNGYPGTGLSLCRAYNYASCRGLEGWVTICLRFDEMVEKMLNLHPEDTRGYQAFMWSLIPLTRAVDKLIITIKNPKSRIGKILKDLADRGYANWYIG